MNRLFAYFSKRKTNDLKALAMELKSINENVTMDSDQRLKKILSNIELAQGIMSVPRERMKA